MNHPQQILGKDGLEKRIYNDVEIIDEVECVDERETRKKLEGIASRNVPVGGGNMACHVGVAL